MCDELNFFLHVVCVSDIYDWKFSRGKTIVKVYENKSSDN